MSTPDNKAPRRWFIPGGIGSFYDGKEVYFAIGPDPQSAPLPDPGGTEVIEASAYDAIVAERDKFRERFEDYSTEVEELQLERRNLEAELQRERRKVEKLREQRDFLLVNDGIDKMKFVNNFNKELEAIDKGGAENE